MSVPTASNEQDLGLGVFLVDGPAGARRLEFRDVDTVAKAIGEPLFIAFAQALHGAERLDAIAHLLVLNDYSDDTKDAVSYRRNLWTLVMMSAGALYESMHALDRLSSAGIKGKVPSSLHWKALDEMRARWAKLPKLKEVRHQLANHLGDPLVYRAGLAKIRTGSMRILVAEIDGKPRRANNAIPFAREILTPALWETEDDFAMFIDGVKNSHANYASTLEKLFFGVLRAAGVKVALPARHRGPARTKQRAKKTRKPKPKR